MGKKRIVTTQGETASGGEAKGFRAPRKKYDRAILYISSTYNNTIISLADPAGHVLTWSSSGSLGFRGAKKGTPFAASKVGELLAERAALAGVKEVDVVVSGVGAGRESAIRSFAGKGGINVSSISDVTPVPHNGPRPPKPRRV